MTIPFVSPSTNNALHAVKATITQGAKAGVTKEGFEANANRQADLSRAANQAGYTLNLVAADNAITKLGGEIIKAAV